MVQTSVLITAASNFGVEYNYGCITEALVWLRALYYIDANHPASTAVSTSVFYGTLFGMVSFGVLGDVIGRNEGMVLTLSIQAIAALLSSLAVAWGGSAEAIWWTVAACRGVIGVGCGGVYPLAAAKANEDAVTPDPQQKAVATAWAFFWRNPGIIAYEAVGLLLLLGPGRGVPEGSEALNASYPYSRAWDVAWRLPLFLGCLAPAAMARASFVEMRQKRSAAVATAMAQPARLQPQSPQAAVASPPRSPAQPAALVRQVSITSHDIPGTEALRRATSFSGREPTSLWQKLVAAEPLRPLLATAGGWLCFDLGFYGNTLMQKRIMTSLLGDVGMLTIGLANLLVSLCAFAFLGLALWVLKAGVLDVVRLQVVGFAANAAIALAVALSWAPLTADPTDRRSTAVLFLLYLCLYGTYWLPKVTTYVVPTVAFPAEVRSTLHGLSAASGKVGGIIGTTMFTSMLAEYDDAEAVLRIMRTCAAAAAVGAALTMVGIRGSLGQGGPACCAPCWRGPAGEPGVLI